MEATIGDELLGTEFDGNPGYVKYEWRKTEQQHLKEIRITA